MITDSVESFVIENGIVIATVVEIIMTKDDFGGIVCGLEALAQDFENDCHSSIHRQEMDVQQNGIDGISLQAELQSRAQTALLPVKL